MVKKVVIGSAAAVVIVFALIILAIISIQKSLPQIIKVEDYKPLLVSQVYDRNGKKIGEFFRERRTLIPYKSIPKEMIQAFLAAEDDKFFEHKGINIQAILRATIANLRAGRSVQGGSTITQQVAKTLMLSPEKTLLRKARDIMLALQMEKNLSKEDILYLYLNQIYFGQGAYGVEAAAQSYFKKPAKNLDLSEIAILAGLPQAPSRYSPISNPQRAKERQVYVLRRMADVGFISKEQAEATIEKPVKVYVREDYEEYAPYFLETVRQILVQQLGETVVLDEGIKIYTSIDLGKQKAANEAMKAGLKELDKRQGYRGALKNLNNEDDIVKFLEGQKEKLIEESTPVRTILADGHFAEIVPNKRKGSAPEKSARLKEEKVLPDYMKVGQVVEGVVERVDDVFGLVTVRFAETSGAIDFESMMWARKPDPDKKSENSQIKKPSDALKSGDVVQVRITKPIFDGTRIKKVALARRLVMPDLSKQLHLELDQEPLVEGALISFDQNSEDVLAMVGGYSFARNEYNRAIQAARQTGSAFKSIVYAAALDRGYNPSTPLLDVPIAFREAGEEGQGDEKVWRPANHGNEFHGEVIMRNALIKSLNLPSVKIIEDIGVAWATDFSKRLGIFSPLNQDFTLVLGSSSVTLYEMTKVFSQFGRLGKRIRPLMIHKVTDKSGAELLQKVSLDIRFAKEYADIEEKFEERRKAYLASLNPVEGEAAPAAEPKKNRIEPYIFFEDPDQLMRPETAYTITSMLRGVVEDPNGTGGRARQLGWPIAAKTGSTNGYYDGWFIGYTAQVATGVWVGFDKERSIGRGEVGGKTALPIWLDYMKSAHEGLPVMTFPVPAGIVSVKIDAETGRLASGDSKRAVDAVYIQGTEPTTAATRNQETTDFLKQDISD